MSSEWASRAGAEHRLRRAAGLGAVGLRVGPELHRHADHLRPALSLQKRSDGTVDAARHRDEHPPLARRRQALGRCGGARQRPVQSVGRELGRVELRRGKPADRRVDLIAADPRGIEDALAAHQVDGRCRRGPHRAASLRVEGRIRDRAAVQCQRDPRQVATGSSPGCPGEGALERRPQPAPVAQVLLEEFSAHSPRRVERKARPQPTVAASGFDPFK